MTVDVEVFHSVMLFVGIAVSFARWAHEQWS